MSLKHIEMVCINWLNEPCPASAFVQVLVVEDAEFQKKIDARANLKLRKALNDEHKEGKHDGR